MSSPSTSQAGLQELLEKLQLKTIEQLLARIETGTATPADISNAIRLLKDNGIQIIASSNNPLGEMADQISKLDFNETHIEDKQRPN